MLDQETKDYVESWLAPIVAVDLEEGSIIVGQYYRYRALKDDLNKWRANDGTILNVSLSELLLDYAFDDPSFLLDMEAEDFRFEYVPNPPRK